MSSDKSVNSNHDASSTVKVKVEPGTSMPVSVRNIKVEPGLPSSTTRLTSFRLPRDLTLGGNIKTEKPKKVYTPNLNAQRNKKKEDATPSKNESGRSKDRDRGRGQGRGGRGRGRGSSNLIQSTGVWSEGITKMSEGRRYGGSGDSDRSSAWTQLEKPKLNLNHTVDKADEEEKLKSLLRDDFIDDAQHPDFDNAPILLPMIEDAKLYKVEPKAETFNEEEDVKPTILENGEVLKPKKESGIKLTKADVHSKEKLPTTVPQVIENKLNSYILIQFPDCLPGLECNNDDSATNRSSDASSKKQNDEKSQTELCTLNSLKSGMLGKLQILQSGKARLCLGDNNLIVDVGSHLSFRQDLIAAKVDTEKLDGDLINLGPVSSTFICSPDWESMLIK
ncbi:hypothetical protein KM043_017939 [Ampulex compressa]|nr:hypothetical protein KM043_017939 [Ampulex compressa]